MNILDLFEESKKEVDKKIKDVVGELGPNYDLFKSLTKISKRIGNLKTLNKNIESKNKKNREIKNYGEYLRSKVHKTSGIISDKQEVIKHNQNSIEDLKKISENENFLFLRDKIKTLDELNDRLRAVLSGNGRLRAQNNKKYNQINGQTIYRPEDWPSEQTLQVVSYIQKELNAMMEKAIEISKLHSYGQEIQKHIFNMEDDLSKIKDIPSKLSKKHIPLNYKNFKDEAVLPASYYLNSFDKFKEIAKQDTGKIDQTIKSHKQNIETLNNEIKNLSGKKYVSDITDKDRESYNNLVNQYNKKQTELETAENILNQYSDNEIISKSDDLKERLKKIGVDQDFFDRNYWKIFFYDRKDKTMFNILKTLFSTDEIEKNANERKNRWLEEYKLISKYSGKGKANEYLKLLLTMDVKDKDVETYSQKANSILKAAKVAKNMNKDTDEKEQEKIYKQSQEDEFGMLPSDNDTAQTTNVKSKAEAMSNMHLAGEKIKTRKGNKNNGYANDENDDEETIKPKPSKGAYYLQKPKNVRPKKEKPTPPYKYTEEKQSLFKEIEKFKDTLPKLYNAASLLANKQSNKINVKELNKEENKISNRIKEIEKEVQTLDNDNKNKGVQPLKEIETILDSLEMKNLTPGRLYNFKKDFNKLLKFTVKYMRKIVSESELKRLSHKGAAISSDDSENRDVREEFKIKRGLINLTKRLYSQDYNNKNIGGKTNLPEEGLNIIKEIQAYVEPYQPKIIKLRSNDLNKQEGDFKVGNIKERTPFGFREIFEIFDKLKNRMSFLEDLPNKKERNKKTEKYNKMIEGKNKKYLEYIDKKNELLKEAEFLKEKLNFYNNVKWYINYNQENKINESKKTETIFKQLFEEFKK